MTVFALVHGGWHGGWCWRRVASRLRAAGHEVHTPTLTGVGDRAHLGTPDGGLATMSRTSSPSWRSTTCARSCSSATARVVP